MHWTGLQMISDLFVAAFAIKLLRQIQSRPKKNFCSFQDCQDPAFNPFSPDRPIGERLSESL